MKARKALLSDTSQIKSMDHAHNRGGLKIRSVKRVRGLLLSALLGAMCFPTSGIADEGTPIAFSFNGFGTAGVAHSSEDQADFTSSVFKPNGAGYSHNWSVDVDSRVGAQITAEISPQLSAVVQVIAEQGYDNTYRPNLEWANIKYMLTSDFSVRLGRIELPTFLVSDVRKVGYANPWVRPPIDVYGVAPLTNSDGVDVSYRTHFGDLSNTLRGVFGPKYKLNFPGAGIDTRNLWGVFDTAEFAAATVHASYLQTHATQNPANPLFTAFRQLGPPGIAIANEYELSNSSVELATIGASYDPGRWFAMSEWTRISSRSFLNVNTGWYASSGYRVGEFTPYVTVSRVAAPKVTEPGLAAANFPSQFADTIAALDGGLSAVLGSTHHVERTLSVGGRWDLEKNIDLKVQYDRTRVGANSDGTLINRQPGFVPGGNVRIISAVVDFVF